MLHPQRTNQLLATSLQAPGQSGDWKLPDEALLLFHNIVPGPKSLSLTRTHAHAHTHTAPISLRHVRRWVNTSEKRGQLCGTDLRQMHAQVQALRTPETASKDCAQ